MRKLLLFTVAVFIISSPFLLSQEVRHYGADYIFEVDDIAVFWAVLKGEDVNSNIVYINVVPLDPEKRKYRKFSVMASNVFSGEEKILINYKKLKKENIIQEKYSEFLNMSERSILLFGEKDSKKNPQIVIYYKGVPDAAPEFRDEEQIKVFFEHSINKLTNLE